MVLHIYTCNWERQHPISSAAPSAMALALVMVQQLRHKKKKRTALLFLPTKTISITKDETLGNNHREPCVMDMRRAVCKQNQLKEALTPSSCMYTTALHALLDNKSLPKTKLVHAHIVQTGFQADTSLVTKLIIAYAKCNSLADARRLLMEVPNRNVVPWSALIAAYAKHGHSDKALTLYGEMQESNIPPNQFTFASVLQACVGLAALMHGRKVHQEIIQSGFESDIFLGCSLIDMYIKCGRLQDARHMFDKMPERDVVSWTAMIGAYARQGIVQEALNLFRQMQQIGIQPNQFTFTIVLPAFADLAELENGRQVHVDIIKSGLDCDLLVGSALVDMYVKCGCIEDARIIFDKLHERNVISWTTMISGYAQDGHSEEALKLYYQMQEAGIQPNQHTLATILPACASLAALENGKEIHRDIIRSGIRSDVFVGSALVDMYAKCGSLEDARNVFERMIERNVISWTSMITGYAQYGYIDKSLELFQKIPCRDAVAWTAMLAAYTQNGFFNDALKFFRQMQLKGVERNSLTFTSILPACASLTALKNGKEVHEDIIKSGLQSDLIVGNALIDMYAKCGIIEDAHKVFNNMTERVAASWNAMIAGFAMHGYGKKAINFFEQMEQYGTKPNHITFVGILSACCHAGLVDDGWKYFKCMSQDYQITPTVEHYGCMVDLLGRAGCLSEAEEFINKMPIKPDVTLWGSLLGSCKIHTNIELGERVAERLFELEPTNASYYVMLSNIYAAAGRWDDVKKLRTLMKNRVVQKMPGCSWIEVNGKVHTFLVGDSSHPQLQKIYAELERLTGQIKEAGYVPKIHYALRDVEEEHKEHILSIHSEKLAIAFGLINTPPGTPIQIVKNLRVCGDCHSATKFISKIVVREIVLRDNNRFHHFKDGQCSCGDYW